jgi:hypothetical protein
MSASNEMPPFEWDAPLTVPAAKANTPQSTAHAPEGDAKQATIRDRYIAARFPGRLRCAADLCEVGGVIEAARLYFEERKVDRALELLDLAVAQSPAAEALQLARIEIAFLVCETQAFCAYARELRRLHPGTQAWLEVARLGRAIAPGDELFGAKQGPRAYENYGPWPHTPNWINASWDLGSEVLASDFHQAMASEAAAASPMENAA